MRTFKTPSLMFGYAGLFLLTSVLLTCLNLTQVQAKIFNWDGNRYINTTNTIKVFDDNGTQILGYDATDLKLVRFTLPSSGSTSYELANVVSIPGFDTINIASIIRSVRYSGDAYESVYYASDTLNNRIWVISAAGKIITSYSISSPQGITVDPASGDLYIVSSSPAAKIVKITASGVISDYLTDSTGAKMTVPSGILISGNYMYIGNTTPLNDNNMVYYVCLSTCDNGSEGTFVSYNLSNTTAGMSAVNSMKADSNGTLYFLNTVASQNGNNYVFKIFAADRTYKDGTGEENFTDLAVNSALLEELISPSPSSDANYPKPKIILYDAYMSSPNSKIRLPGNLTGELLTDPGIDISNTGSRGTRDVLLKTSAGEELARISADFDASRSWSFSADSDRSGGRSYTSGLVTQEGAAPNYSLYVPIPLNWTSDEVRICPQAESFDDIYSGCPAELILSPGMDGAQKVSSAMGDYWVVPGMTGTGGQSILTGFSVRDSLSRLQSNTAADHTIDFGTGYGMNSHSNSIKISFPISFDLGTLTTDDIDLQANGTDVNLSNASAIDTWGVAIANTALDHSILLTAPLDGSSSGFFASGTYLTVKIGTNATFGANSGTNQIVNPASGQYEIAITEHSAGGIEDGTVTIPVIDSDHVNITSFVNTYISFDIDTALDDIECSVSTCLNHANGTPSGNYSIDLGEMNSLWINQSNNAGVLFADTGTTEQINSIYLDLTTNAINGAIVTVHSANGGLQGPGSNFIPACSDGDTISTNSGLYGFAAYNWNIINGSMNINPDCNSDLGGSCGLVKVDKLVFDSNAGPIEAARVRIDISAAASYVDNPGSYSDTLTFTAVSTY